MRRENMVLMRYRLLAGLLLYCLAAGAQTIDVAQLKSFIETSQKNRLTDAEVARYLKSVKLTDRLEDRTIKNWLALGIGARTRAALEALRDQSKALAAVKPAESPKADPPPSNEEQGRILDEVRGYALNYTQGLPNFLCTQVTHRKVAPTNAPRYDGEPPWQTQDTLTIRLSYFEQKEDYHLLMINNSPTTQDYAKLGGASSTGEFGTMMNEIFARHTEARFEWDHWATIRGRLSMAFRYHVDQTHSGWTLDYLRREHITPAYHGLVFIDKERHVVTSVTLQAENIPLTFPIHKAETTLDYGFADIAGHEFLLPLRSQTDMSVDGELSRNEIEFHLYRKYSAESEINFNITPDPPPVDCKDPKNAGNPACKK
jgi:hypothetical protein